MKLALCKFVFFSIMGLTAGGVGLSPDFANAAEALAPSGSAMPRMSVDHMKILYFEAAREGRNDVIESFLKAGLATEVKDSKGYTPLILAAYNEHPSTVKLLLDHGAQPCAEDNAGNTALMGVAFKGNAEILKMLIKVGCSVNHQNKEGQTALMMASLFGRIEVIKTLLASGADQNIKDKKGDTALSLARLQGNKEVQTILTEADTAKHP